MSLKEEMEEKISSDGVYKAVRINNVPKIFWDEEFKSDAKANFADNYIMKIMVDHFRRIEGDERINMLIERIAVIEERLHELSGKTIEKEDPTQKIALPRTFGGIGELKKKEE